ncbi:MAG: hypothetical protein ACYDCC_08025 [Actinomycetota bacterium]
MLGATKQSDSEASVQSNLTGYVLIQLERNASENLIRMIENHESVARADLVTGPYDMILTPQLGTRPTQIVEILAEIEGVRKALPCDPA